MNCGVVEGVDFLELRNRVLKLEESFAELAKWTKFNQQETQRNYNAAGDEPGSDSLENPSTSVPTAPPPLPVANVDGAAVPENGGGESTPGNGENDGNQEGDLDVKICACKAELTDAEKENEEQQDGNNGIGNPQRTSPDKTLPVTKLPEAVASVERQNDDRTMMPSTAAEGSRNIAEEQGSNGEDVILPQIKIETEDEVCQCKVENESDSDEGSSTGSPGAKNPKKRSSKKKSTTATDSTSLELKSAFVSLKRLSSDQILSIKKKMAAKSKQWKCPHCPKICSNNSDLRKHSFVHTDEQPFRCPHCPIALKQAHFLRAHIRKFHPKENQNLLACKICQQKFQSQKSRTLHMRKHLKCYFCQIRARDLYDMRQHFATHTGEKPFSCPHCPHSTAWEATLRIHIHKKHPHVKQSLRKGAGKVWIPKGPKIQERQFNCYFCSYKTNQFSSLVSHVRTHTGEKPFNCSRCPYAAKDKSSLNSHSRTRH